MEHSLVQRKVVVVLFVIGSKQFKWIHYLALNVEDILWTGFVRQIRRVESFERVVLLIEHVDLLQPFRNYERE